MFVLFDEVFFFGSGEVLYVPLQAHGFLFGVGFDQEDQFHGTLGAGAFAGRSSLMGSQTFFDVVGPAAVVIPVF